MKKIFTNPEGKSRFEAYFKIVITALITFCFSTLYYHYTKSSPCRYCLNCDVIQTRIDVLQVNISQLESELIAYEKKKNDALIIKTNAKILDLNIRLKEAKNIINNLNQTN